ncbi:MAG: hypothetical protein H7A33_07270 [Deltaproteobacteria bacterium]|nr:hypothetical protein [Deltaproteobacteria bacterium]
MTDFEGRTGVSSDSTTLSLTTVGDDASKGSYSVYVKSAWQADRNILKVLPTPTRSPLALAISQSLPVASLS